MSQARTWRILTPLVIVLALVLGWAVVVSPKRGAADELQAQALSQQQANQALQLQISQLQQRASELPEKLAELKGINAKIPVDPAIPELVRTLSDEAQRSGVRLTTITPGVPTEYVAVAAPAATTGTASVAPATPAAPAVADLYVVPLTIEFTGTFDDVRQYINALENVPRAITFMTNSISRSDVAGSGLQLTASLAGSVFYSPAAALTPTISASPAPTAG